VRKFILLILVCLVASCAMINGSGKTRPGMPPFMPGPPKGGPPEFQEGWQDGCETGIAAHGSSYYRSTFKFTQNPSLVMNPIYYKAWKDGENYCRTYIFAYSFRNMEVSCTLDGLVDDCGGPETNSVPGFGQSTNATGYGFMGSGDNFMGGSDNFMGGNDDGVSGVMGNW
jgi:hypothetical protein